MIQKRKTETFAIKMEIRLGCLYNTPLLQHLTGSLPQNLSYNSSKPVIQIVHNAHFVHDKGEV